MKRALSGNAIYGSSASKRPKPSCHELLAPLGWVNSVNNTIDGHPCPFNAKATGRQRFCPFRQLLFQFDDVYFL